MSEYRGIARWAEDAVGMINWDDTTKEGTAQVFDEKTGTVYQIGGGGGDDVAEVTLNIDIGSLPFDHYQYQLDVQVDEDLWLSNTAVTSTNPVIKVGMINGSGYIGMLEVVSTNPNEDPYIIDPSTIVTTGGVEYDTEFDSFHVTGDGTITASLLD